MFLVFSFQYVKELFSDKSESVMNIGIEPIPFPDPWIRNCSHELIQQYVNKERIQLLTLPSGGERGRTDDLLNANQAL